MFVRFLYYKNVFIWCCVVLFMKRFKIFLFRHGREAVLLEVSDVGCQNLGGFGK